MIDARYQNCLLPGSALRQTVVSFFEQTFYDDIKVIGKKKSLSLRFAHH